MQGNRHLFVLVLYMWRDFDKNKLKLVTWSKMESVIEKWLNIYPTWLYIIPLYVVYSISIYLRNSALQCLDLDSLNDVWTRTDRMELSQSPTKLNSIQHKAKNQQSLINCIFYKD